VSAVLAMVYRANPVDTVRTLLREWTAYRRRWSPDIGYPHAVPWLDEVRGSVDGWTEGADYDMRIKANEMRQVDEAVRLELSHDHQHAIFVVYLNEIGPAVWRSARKATRSTASRRRRSKGRMVSPYSGRWWAPPRSCARS
jgi:hypothetical protein